MSGLGIKSAGRPAHIRQKSSSRAARVNDSQSERNLETKRKPNKKATEIEKSDAATSAFVRRVLCASHLKPGADLSNSQSLEELLPPLTSSNEVDLQLYGLIAVIIKSFVQTWYSKITPDHEFTDEIIQIIAHCTRAFEQRLRRVDLEALLLDEIPDLLNQHAEAYRLASHSSNGMTAQYLGVSTRTIYHSIRPHPALSPVPTESRLDSIDAQISNETAWRQLLIEGVLELLLPPEDLKNPCLKILLNEIFSELIIGNVLGGKVSEGWFLWEGITKAIQAVRTDGAAVPENLNPKRGARLEQFGLLSADDPARAPDRAWQRTRSIYALIVNAGWELLRIALLLFGLIRAAFTALSDAVYLPPRRVEHHSTSSVASSPSSSFISSPNLNSSQRSDVVQDPTTKTAIIDMSAWRVPVTILGLNTSMPWLIGAASLIQHYAVHGPGKVGGVDARVDRLLSHQIATHVLDPSRLPALLRTVRVNLFPNNAMGQGKPPPSNAEEVAAIKRKCAEEIRGLIPAAVRGVYFGKAREGVKQEEWEVERVEEDVLGLLEDGYCNKHFLFAVVEVVLCRVFPELMQGREEE
ncbi:PXA domain-containing protein 1 [Elsinoe australis]|uniref:PXA domain-containing protein 1 n=1 Tax=Elsinoe australis TaxID=40998 RepID=A0A4U7BAW6_9PEZI|nr:PXA domain-containing protein 1 [Elsinoe australis]